MRILLSLIVAALLASIPGAAQAPSCAKAGAPAKAAAKKWRTPWGDPDLQGTWSNATTTPLERPAKYGGREFKTADERAAEDKETAIGRDKRHAPGSTEDVADAYNA